MRSFHVLTEETDHEVDVLIFPHIVPNLFHNSFVVYKLTSGTFYGSSENLLFVVTLFMESTFMKEKKESIA